MTTTTPTRTPDAAPSSVEDPRKLQALKALSELPPFSPILSKLMASFADEDVSFAALGELIEKDAVVTGNVLQVVNSAIFARRSTVNSVRHALSLLGAAKIRNLVLGMQVAGLWKQSRCPEGWSMVGFNMHSAAVGTLADMVAQQLPVEYPEGAFVAGLLHDLGRMLISMGLPREFSALSNESARRKLAMIDCERELLGFTHAELSGVALRKWKLPEQICLAVEQHHSAPVASEGEVALSRVICAADAYVNSIGLTVAESSPAKEPDFGALLELGLAKARVEKLVADFDAEFQAAAQFFR